MSEIQQAFYRLAPHIVDFEPSDEGVIEYGNRRFVFFHTRMFAALFEKMEEVAGPVIRTRIRRFGEEAGQEIAGKLDSQFRETGLFDALQLLVASGFDTGSL
ncbi:MAG: hypothetical protein SVU32_02425, partial [Candidatus Nanohaloarchaea archaeon]|nr:hypothetical protein [Candidatus Nanohaloarchaea archaeon]